MRLHFENLEFVLPSSDGTFNSNSSFANSFLITVKENEDEIFNVVSFVTV